MSDYRLIKQQEAAKIDFAIMLDDLLDTKGLTQSDLAVRAGKSKSLISRLMGGDSNPTIETMVSVLHAIGENLVITTESRLSREYTTILSMQAANTLPDKTDRTAGKWTTIDLPAAAWRTESRAQS